jgi:hypothetical protein
MPPGSARWDAGEVSCCDDDEDPPTVRHLIHDLSSYWIDQGKPVYVSFHDSSGEFHQFVVTGVTSTARGQSLELGPVDS